MAKFLLFLLTLALVAASTGDRGRALAGGGWDNDDLPQRQQAMEDAVRVMATYDPERHPEAVQRAIAFVNSEIQHLRPIAKAVHRMPENSPAEIRAKAEARVASGELLTRHLSSLLPGGSVKMVDDL